jgi:serine/threonine protein kinase
MSPEQLCGRELDARSDVYSLAFMAYEMLTGKLPFEGQTAHEIMVARLQGVSVPIRTQRPDLDIPVPVERVLARALTRDPDERYASATAFGDALSGAAAGEGPGRASGVWRWIRTTVGR